MEWVPLPPAINPLSAVRRTTKEVMQRAFHVSLDGAAVEQLAKMWASDGGAGGASVGWNETGWHYSEDAASGGVLTCQYVFVLGASSKSLVLVCAFISAVPYRWDIGACVFLISVYWYVSVASFLFWE